MVTMGIDSLSSTSGKYTLEVMVKMMGCYLFLVQPGLDRGWVMEELLSFFGSAESMAYWMTLLSPHFFRAIPLAFFTFCDFYPGIFSKYKVNQDFRLREMPKWDGFKLAAWETMLNTVFIYHPIAYLASIGVNSENTSPETVPYGLDHIGPILCAQVVLDFVFYTVHRLFHEVPWLYAYHKSHHTYKDVNPLSMYHLSLVDSALGVTLSTSIFWLFYPGHFYTMFCFTLTNAWSEVVSHSGYDMPWMFYIIPGCSIGRAHSEHHRYSDCYYGGTTTFFDHLFGTTSPRG